MFPHVDVLGRTKPLTTLASVRRRRCGRIVSLRMLFVAAHDLAVNNVHGFLDGTWRAPIRPSRERGVGLQGFFYDKGLTGYFADAGIVGGLLYPNIILGISGRRLEGKRLGLIITED